MSETLFASCPPGAEPALSAELKRAGHGGHVERGGVVFSGPTGLHQWANVWLRCADRVRLQVAKVSRPEALRELDWKPYLAADAALKLEPAGDGTAEFTRAARRFWKTADQGLPVQLRMTGRECVVSLDSSGELLHFRGYRQELGKAPLRETLASAMLELSGYQPEAPLVDVMCGSGTLLIEAAWRALNKAPGRKRTFAFQRWPSFDAKAFEKLPRQLPGPVVPHLYGSDLNAGALGVARRNGKRAGVQELLVLNRVDARTACPPEEGELGLVVANLPYGIRAGEKKELEALYKALGANLGKVFSGWKFGFLLLDGEEHLQLPITHTYPLENGGLRCRLVVGTVV